MIRHLLAPLAAAVLLASCTAEQEPAVPVVMAASSLQEALGEAAAIWTAKGNPAPVLTFAGTSSLARQVLAGAPADLFISADNEWMDELAAAGRIVPESRTVLAGNGLVLVVPADSDAAIQFDIPATFTEALRDSRLAMADPDAVPAGRYGKAALESLGLWDAVAGRITSSENVRAALALVERGEAPVGVVYSSDAAASDRVRIAATFPADSHPPIHYPMARIAGSASDEAEAFRAFLLSPEGQQILVRHGFTGAPQ